MGQIDRVAVTPPAGISHGGPFLFPGIANDADHPGDMALLRWTMIANGTTEPAIRRGALIKVAEEAMRLASLAGSAAA